MLAIHYKLEGAGWSECVLVSDGSECRLTASYLGDALGNLVSSALCMLTGYRYVSFSFSEEPGEYRWNISHTGYGRLNISILWFGGDWAELPPDEKGKEVFRTKTNVLEYGRAVHKAASNVLEVHGLEGYKEEWVEHAFPKETLALLLAQIQRLEAVSWALPKEFYDDVAPNK